MGGFVNPKGTALGGGSAREIMDRRSGALAALSSPEIAPDGAPGAASPTVGTEEAAAVAEGLPGAPTVFEPAEAARHRAATLATMAGRKTLANSGKARAAKGANGEREVLAALRMTMENVEAELTAAGASVVGRSEFVTRKRIERNKSSEDIGGLPIISVEVKRQEALNVGKAWEQAVRQADGGRLPCLVYKYNREPWRVRTWMALTDPDGSIVSYSVGEIALPDFLAYYAKLYRRFLERQSA